MGVARGVDMFDCVLPTRLARNGALFTLDGRVNIKQRRFAELHQPLDPDCDCETCTQFSAAYLHHLFRAGEILGLRLASVHNLRFLARQVEAIRAALELGQFAAAHGRFDAQSYRNDQFGSGKALDIGQVVYVRQPVVVFGINIDRTLPRTRIVCSTHLIAPWAGKDGPCSLD